MTQADVDLRAILQRVREGDTESLPALLNGNLWIGDQPNANYPQGGITGHSLYDALATGQITEPDLLAFAHQSLTNANLKDHFNFLTSAIAPPLIALGLVGGAAGLGLGAGAEAAAAGGAEAAGAGAGAFAGPAIEGGELTGTALGLDAGTTLGTGATATGAGTGSGLEGLDGLLATSGEAGGAGEALTAPLPEGAGVLSTSAASPELVAGSGAGGAGGIGGSGVTVSQAAKLGSAGLSLGSTVGALAGGGGGGSSDSTAEAPDPNQEALLAQLRNLGLDSSVVRAGASGESQLRQQSLANASQQEFLKSASPAIAQIRGKLQQMFKAISGTLGPSGGGQIERAQRNATEQAGGGLQSLFANQASGGIGNLLQSLQGFKPTNVAQVPQTVQTTTQIPNQFGNLPGATEGIGKLYTAASPFFATRAPTVSSEPDTTGAAMAFGQG